MLGPALARTLCATSPEAHYRKLFEGVCVALGSTEMGREVIILGSRRLRHANSHGRNFYHAPWPQLDSCIKPLNRIPVIRLWETRVWELWIMSL